MARRLRSGGRLWRVSAVLALLLTSVFLVPGLAAASPTPSSGIGGLPSNPPSYLAAGAVMSTSKSSEHNIISATSPTSSIPGSWSDTFELVYFWNQTAGRPNVAVMEAVLSVIFFGATISSRTEVENPPITTSPGTITLNASFGQYQYLFGGLFAMTASLVASNGSTAWGQSFYVTIGQPWDITAVSGILIVIALYEIYAIVTCGKGERRAKPKPTLAQPAPAASPPSETAPATSSAPGTGGEPYPSESPPPSGGS